jgi:hypothetical protein
VRDGSWGSCGGWGETRRVRLDLEAGDLIFGDFGGGGGGGRERGVRTVGRRRGSECSKDIVQVGQRSAISSLRSRLDPDPVPAATVPCLPCPPRPAPTATTSSDYNTEHRITAINNNVAIQRILWDHPSPSYIMTSLLLPLLRCPLCPDHSTLTAPVTLFCGHTLCAKHVSVPAHLSSLSPQSHTRFPILLRLTPCPLQGCTASPATPVPLNIPPASHITFYPAVGHHTDHDAASFATIPDSRIDVTVNKLSMIIHQHRAQSTRHLPSADSGSGSDSQTDEEILDPRDLSPTRASIAGSSANTGEGGPSSIPRQVSSDGSQQPGPARMGARKRRRKRVPPPRRLDAPAQSADQFEKELLTELSCEICLTLLYQPITSPCQHVSYPLLVSFILVDPPPFCQTFCAKCLHRSLDHTNRCPLCRQLLPGFSYFQDHPLNKTIMSISMPFHPLFFFSQT